MDVQSEGESGREFRREATRIHCKEREGREREGACPCRNVIVFGVWEMGRADCTIPGVEEGVRGGLRKISNNNSISFSPHQ